MITWILPNLALGDWQDVIPATGAYDFSLVMNCAKDCDLVSDVITIKVPLVDGAGNDKQLFQKAVEALSEELEKGKVLVHCISGISRSAAIVIGYLHKKKGMTINNAYLHVRRLRPSINPKPELLGLIKDC